MNSQRRKEIAKVRDQLAKLKDELDLIAEEVERIRDEEQEYYDNMPESFQNAERGERAQEAINALDDVASELSNLDIDDLCAKLDEAAGD